MLLIRRVNSNVLFNTQSISQLFTKKLPKEKINQLFKTQQFYLRYNPKYDANLKNENKEKDYEYYTPKESLVFKNKKLTIVKANKELDRAARLYGAGMSLSGVIIAYKIGMNMYFFSPLYVVLWACPALILSRFVRVYRDNRTIIIRSINLLDDGKTLELETLGGITIVKIGNIRKPKPEELVNLINFSSSGFVQNYAPLIVNDHQTYLIPKNLDESRKDILHAVISKQYINLNGGESTIDDSKVIDL